MDAGGVEALGFRVDMARDGVGAEDMGGERIELRRRVSQEVGEGDGRERVGVGVIGGVRENHCEYCYSRS